MAASDYKATLNLPQTAFPMKAGLARREPERLARWEAMDLAGAIERARAGGEPFTLHDGPPYANGHLHMGHALNKVLKDVIVKLRTMEGRRAVYVPGWDCHGLPIERQVDKELGPRKRELDTLAFRQACRDYAARFVAIQRDEFRRLGVLGRWDRPYLTMDPAYEAAIVREFGRIVANGHVYHGRKPVHWCPTCVTALAEAEVEYADHTSPSIHVAFEVEGGCRALDPELPELPLALLVWTTTPWTIPANLAVCVHPDYDYRVVRAGGRAYVVAEYLLPAVEAAAGWEEVEPLARRRGAELTRLTYTHPLNGRRCPVITGDHVTLEAGTGLVHTAPGHGQEDYEVGLAHDLEVYAPVDDRGRFTEAVGEPLAGMGVFEANPEVVRLLRQAGALVAEGSIDHSYPHCWRCKRPVIFRATPQWFISMEAGELRRRALEAIDRVTWIPAWGRNRIHAMVASRPDWCISRQRQWGVPVVAFHCRACGEPFTDAAAAERVAAAAEREGADCWYTHPVADWLGEGAACPRCGSSDLAPEEDILDVWFDSGVSHAAVLLTTEGLTHPADLYLEGSDQHRGWFHSSLLAALAAGREAPYRAVLTHGFVVDGEGRKMSKSVGNVIAPEEVIRTSGADILRLWVASEDFRDDLRLSPAILKQLGDAYRRVRNTLRFLLGNLADFRPEADAVAYEAMEPLDRYALHRHAEVGERVRAAYDAYELHTVYHTLHTYCVNDLSGFYLDILKDRLYTEAAASGRRRSAQTALWEIAEGLVRWLAPILCFTADEAWEHLPPVAGREPSVHLARFAHEGRRAPELAAEWEGLRAVRGRVLAALERARERKEIGGSLTAAVTVYAEGETRALLERHAAELADLWIVSQAAVAPLEAAPPGLEVAAEGPRVAVAVAAAPGEKCGRCWRILPEVGEEPDHPDLCRRCASVVRALEAAGEG